MAVTVDSQTKEHASWVQSMAKYRRLAPMDDNSAITTISVMTPSQFLAAQDAK